MNTVFLHGLDSSSKGTKAMWFRQNFPEMLIPDFAGTLEDRMDELHNILQEKEELVLIGSSFGGLMATIYTIENQHKVKKVILLSPALNFSELLSCPKQRVIVATHLYVGRQDTVCPPDSVVPIAQEIFNDLSVNLEDDDHLLRNVFFGIDWASMLETRKQ